jgi:hypothetical protein
MDLTLESNQGCSAGMRLYQDRTMAPSTTRIQLDAALRRYPAIDRLLGALLRLRCEAANPECFLLALY